MPPMRTSHICTHHHFLPINTCSDCPAQHPTCGCIASAPCLAQAACFSSLMIQPTDNAGRTSSHRFVRVISSLLCPRLSLPCMCLHRSLCASYVFYMTFCCGFDSLNTVVFFGFHMMSCIVRSFIVAAQTCLRPRTRHTIDARGRSRVETPSRKQLSMRI